MGESRFSRLLFDEICRQVAGGKTLREVCRAEGMPPESTVRYWVVEDRDGCAAQYARAREAQAEAWADELIEVAEDGSNDWMERQRRDGKTETVVDREHIARSDLRVKTRQWLMARNHAARFGDKIKQEHTGPNGGPAVTEVVYRWKNDSDPD